jgi:hypothetical protein
MTSEIINVILVVICIMAASKCFQKSAMAFLERERSRSISMPWVNREQRKICQK